MFFNRKSFVSYSDYTKIVLSLIIYLDQECLKVTELEVNGGSAKVK